ncbi:MAG: hypothetical protein H7326_11005 [Bdellovibrionaceae bacterium]|nr:hypothetical protein [Pseudobdellovibrionaceae bacterium]
MTYKSHSYAKATELLRQGIAQSPKNRDTYEMRINLGIILRVTQKFDEARSVFVGLLADLKRERDTRFQNLIPLTEDQLRDLPKANF